jgi:hypothetical protein
MSEHTNEQNMAKVREMMVKNTAEQVNQGAEAQAGVPINYTSDYGKQYTGNVVFKRPSVMDFMKMGGIKSEILRTAGVKDVALVDGGVKFMAQVIATLKTVIVKSPEWLVNIDGVKDTDLLFHVYGKYEEWEDSFRPKPSANTTQGDSKPTE